MDEDKESTDRIAELEQSLIDERALRSDSQARARDLEERAALWRSRAEERAERIAKLESEPRRSAPERWLRTLRGGGSRIAPGGRPPTLDASTRPSRTSPAIPGTSILHNTAGPLAGVLGEGNARPLDARPWDSADLVVVDPNRLPADGLEALHAWVETSPRPPTVVVSDDHHAWPGADTTIGTGGVQLPDPIGDEGRGGTPTAELLSAFKDGESVVRSSEGNPVGLLIDQGVDPYASLGQAGVRPCRQGCPRGPFGGRGSCGWPGSEGEALGMEPPRPCRSTGRVADSHWRVPPQFVAIRWRLTRVQST